MTTDGPAHDTLLELMSSVDAASLQPFLLDPAGEAIATYGDAARRSAQFANALRAVGLLPGDRLAMQVDKCAEALMLYLACVRAGIVLLPMNTGYTASEVAHLVGDAEPSLVVDNAGLVELGRAADDQSTEFVDHRSLPEDLAAILYTSGTTGRPKGTMLSHRNLASNARTLRALWGFEPGDVLLHALPIFHTHGLFVATNCSIANGSAMVFLPKFEIDAVLEALPRCTVMMGVPTFYSRLLAEDRFGGAAAAHVRLFISGSAPLLASVHAEFHDRTGHAILERYGMTETSMLTSNPLHGERRPGTVGFALPDVEVRVADENGHVVPTGEIGGVEVSGPNVFAGYWRRPELAATEFTADGFFRTGDVGMFDGDGYLHIVGRSKDLIISGGLNVYPKEVESVLDELPGVLESAVIGVPDADFGEAVVAVVVGDGTAGLDVASLRAAARERLAAFKTPKQIHVVESLPRNAMGKVEKAVLRRTYGGGS
jgi:malonyl-CoA/methylmalonyl-CoA synthetase